MQPFDCIVNESECQATNSADEGSQYTIRIDLDNSRDLVRML
jgi:hypothetical protein